MQNTRQYERFSLKAGEITATMDLTAKQQVLDISADGISLKSYRRLNIGNEYALRLKDGKKVISLTGIVEWSSLCGSEQGLRQGVVIPIYKAGMRFKDVSEEQKNELLNFIREHAQEKISRDQGRRLGMRFQMKTMEKALLKSTQDYMVKEISLNGMLIGSMLELEIQSLIPLELCFRNDVSIRLMGRVASCRLVNCSAQNRYLIGIKFLDMTDKDKETLHEFIGESIVPGSLLQLIPQFPGESVHEPSFEHSIIVAGNEGHCLLRQQAMHCVTGGELE